MTAGPIKGFAGWAPGDDPEQAWTSAVDSNGRRWTPGSDGTWTSDDGHRQAGNHNHTITGGGMTTTDEQRAQRVRDAHAGVAAAVARGGQQAAQDIYDGEKHRQQTDFAGDTLRADGGHGTPPIPQAGPGAGSPAASEVTGIRSAIAQLASIADAHAAISNAEGFLGSLRQMDVGEGDRQRFLEAQQASQVADVAWRTATDTIRRHNDPVGEAYRTSPGAGNKHANTNE